MKKSMDETVPVLGDLGSPKRSSLFELTLRKPEHTGSSILSFAHEPSNQDDDQVKKGRKIHYENTYRMEPAVKFKVEQVSSIIREVLQSHLEGHRYDPVQCSPLTKTMAQEIKTKVKALDFKRYKIIATVTLGQKHDQGVRIGSRCIWDADRDNYASANYDNEHLYAVGVVYAVYYE